MRYVESLPPAPLRPFVHCLWQLRGRLDAPQPVQGTPDARADVVFDLAGGADRAIADGAACALVGTASRPHTATLRGEVDLFGISFRAGGARAFFGLPLAELTDGRAAWATPPVPADELAGLGFDARVGAVLPALHAAAARARPDPVVAAAVAAVRAGAVTGVRELCAACGVGERLLERRFRAEVGLSPRTFVRIARFRAARGLVVREPDLALAAVALRSGYCDQAHLCREFARFAGESPGRFRAQRVGSVQAGGAAGG